MNRVKPFVAALLVLLWMPVASFCLVEACGLTKKGGCCPEEQSAPVPAPQPCDKPCGLLASGNCLPQHEPLVVLAPADVLLFHAAPPAELHVSDAFALDPPATEPPELAGSWRFSVRAALPPRAPSCLS